MKLALQARGLRKAYGKGEAELEALRGVDVDIAVGEFTSIMGPSGSGKSTLLHLIGLLDAPTSGSLRLMDQLASDMTARERALCRRKNLGFVFQAFHLLPRATALQNVMLPMALAGMARSRRRERAADVLASVGLADRLHHRPSQLSGGQKQRVAIARALALDPPIILADEPTGNLDSATSQDVMRLFGELNRRGKTIIQVTHEPAMAAYGRRIIQIQDGRVAGGHARLAAWSGPQASAPATPLPAAAATPPPASPTAAAGPKTRSRADGRVRPIGQPEVVDLPWRHDAQR